ncbi:hypothetical protein N7535_005022 [Penicillium sp. DV-2018c]|nr:hypothetical protein N7461_008603 [Penicillium sp. DV-2018c]KAJ5571362.1 hypothetical protein N7535_005022 [Penicillium sp. DV-2018c]
MSRVLKSEPPAQRQVHTTLMYMARNVECLRVDELDLQQLENLNVDVVPLALDETSPHQPSYFAPLPSHSIPEPNDDDLGESFNGHDDETEDDDSSAHPADRAYWMSGHLEHYISYYEQKARGDRFTWVADDGSEFPGTALCDSDMDNERGQPDFVCYDIAEPEDPAYPHAKAIMFNNLIPTDSSILYGELISILRIMLTQLRMSKFLHQFVTPVLIFSLMGFQARVIEAFFKDDKLVLRLTKFYDFSHGNRNAFKTFALWWLGNPVGTTTQTS